MTPEKILVDQKARDAIRNDLDATLVVEAAAGTGKTTELVARVLALLTSGKATLASTVAVTFTEKAAGEMKLRLRTEIEKARRDATDEVRARLDRSLSELEAAHIGTIHAFCAELLRERPVEARVDPLFMAADEGTQERLFDEAFERFFQRELQNPHEAIRRMLRKQFHSRSLGGPRNLLRRAGLQLIEQRDFDHPWRRDPFDRRGELDAIVTRLRELSKHWDAALDKTTWLAQNLLDVKRFIHELDRREQIQNESSPSGASTWTRDDDGLEEELRTLSRVRTWKYVGGPKQFSKGVAKQTVIDERDAVRADLESVLQRAEADLAACLHRDLQALVKHYSEVKRKLGKLDFLDLLIETHDMLVSNAKARTELQARFTHVLVDEFQDTDPLQAEILLLLCSRDPAERNALAVNVVPGKLFVVGDPKQSIYRFRRADVILYERVKRQLLAQGAVLLNLQTSFRSTPAIQSAINASFAPRMQGSADGSQAEYVALEKYREDPPNQPSLVALPVPRPYSDKSGKVTQWAVSESLPDACAAFVDWLVRESKWTVQERGERVAIEPRHVCLLFRRFVSYGDDVTRGYVRALEARRVPHVLVGGRSFYKREEVVALKNALAAIEWPDDELSVFATLRGPLFAIADDALLLYRTRHRALRPTHIAHDLDEQTKPITEALAILRELHIRRNRRPIADSIAELLEKTRAHAGIAIWPTGEQALANLLRLLDDARRFEAAGATSFRAFVRHLEDEEDRGGGAEAPVVEEGTEGVRIMTVHKAKGLEFPVVILVDPSCSLTSNKPSRYLDPDKKLWATTLEGCTPIELIERREMVLRHDEEEAVRLTYVAATRARDLLVVPVIGDEGIDPGWWLAPLGPAVYPRPDDWRAAHEAPGCPLFGDDSVLERPQKTERDKRSAVRPGLHIPQSGTHTVAWWDPSKLKLTASQDAGLRQQRILAVDETSGRDAESEREHDAWRTKRHEAIEHGKNPTHRVEIVTTRSKLGGPVSLLPVAVHKTDADRAGRPRGKSFGVLVHAVLAEIALDASDEAENAVAAVAHVQARMLGASDSDAKHAAVAALAALRHPLVREAASSDHRREAPILLREPDGTLVEGVLDLAFRRGEKWIIVDFKTDQELADAKAAYEAQVRLYARAVSEATGAESEAALLLV